MKKVFKYELDGFDTIIEAPEGFVITQAVLFDKQELLSGPYSVWLELSDDELDVSRLPSKRRYAVFPTGAAIHSSLTHIKSVKDPDGFHIWHLYEGNVL